MAEKIRGEGKAAGKKIGTQEKRYKLALAEGTKNETFPSNSWNLRLFHQATSLFLVFLPSDNCFSSLLKPPFREITRYPGSGSFSTDFSMANRIFERSCCCRLDPFLYFPIPFAFPFVILNFIVENRLFFFQRFSLSVRVCIYLFPIEHDPRDIFDSNSRKIFFKFTMNEIFPFIVFLFHIFYTFRV